ncbi:hypothetical protein F4861DRAFT_287916 [Xylaria intraflava]|nr:hypothetical protein F4861DRAFT_287916 [Xylaria intraflava]
MSIPVSRPSSHSANPPFPVSILFPLPFSLSTYRLSHSLFAYSIPASLPCPHPPPFPSPHSLLQYLSSHRSQFYRSQVILRTTPRTITDQDLTTRVLLNKSRKKRYLNTNEYVETANPASNNQQDRLKTYALGNVNMAHVTFYTYSNMIREELDMYVYFFADGSASAPSRSRFKDLLYTYLSGQLTHQVARFPIASMYILFCFFDLVICSAPFAAWLVASREWNCQ